MEKAVKSEQIYNSFSVNSLAGSVPTLHLQSPMKTMLFKTVSEPNLNIYLRCVHLYVLVDLAAKRLENGKIKITLCLAQRSTCGGADELTIQIPQMAHYMDFDINGSAGQGVWVAMFVLKWWAAQGYWWLMMMATHTHTHWIHQFPHSK